MQTNEQIAQDLLDIQAVTLSPQKPFVWASGIKAPIYTDNRLTIGYPEIRSRISAGLARLIIHEYPDVTDIGGVVTAGIPHATSTADRLGLPLMYVRSKPKDHGAGKQVEGHVDKEAKVVLIDDLISTGGSVLKAAEAVEAEGITVLGVAAIFTYELPAARENFAAAKLPLVTLTNYSTLIRQAEKAKILTGEEKESLLTWREDPWAWK
ncbi:orotate phosphoribosyltransferase [Schleiferilactobacillus perolens]|uniref:Orotate phosphoribosyltransferase n=1 Tax=Schleiferilactobacillus perolens DSM 12744 TaxID=1423792 RepID=A0A0R1MPN5_9LACO|nr:orotate phosphoribosyltransferase [Schleiferilactobacillus perolens]KRL10048.1 orotate phosphoribosyltransferase [Schleiferilactobacillus perolens DSM 12744]